MLTVAGGCHSSLSSEGVACPLPVLVVARATAVEGRARAIALGEVGDEP